MDAAGSLAAQATDAGSVPGTAGGIGGSPVTAGEPGLLGDETEQEGAEPMPLPVVGHGERDLGALGTDPRVHGMGDDPSVRRERDESDAVHAVHLDRMSSRRAQVDAEGQEPEGPRVGRERAEEVVQRLLVRRDQGPDVQGRAIAEYHVRGRVRDGRRLEHARTSGSADDGEASVESHLQGQGES